MIKELYDTVIKATGIPKNFFDGDPINYGFVTVVEDERRSKVKDDYVDRLKSIL
jgi:hypothetical protein